MPEPECQLIEKPNITCKRLDDPTITTAIFQGLITSADSIYHLTKLGEGKYVSHADKEKPIEV
ncbi:hypothetical protein [uncultured Thiothrix sp.]|uniref:hypothetical protein n=1 Tax=uncultured Thiothrix sp. TaxID=223185 RepID=UPI002632AEC4|nr:hypothetical protein [uncultured Thiothrix sp.]